MSRTCIHCGKIDAPDRKQRCNHCGEVFHAPADPSEINSAPPEAVAETATSRRGVVVGLILALAIPASYWLLAVLVHKGIAPYDQVHASLGSLGAIALLEILLGPVGIGIAAWSAGVRDAFAWVALIILGIPAVALIWFFSVANLSGALGNPF